MSLSTKGHDFLAKEEGYAGLDSKTCSETVTSDCGMSNDAYGFYDDSLGYCTVGIGKFIAKKDCADIDKYQRSSLCRSVFVNCLCYSFSPNGSDYGNSKKTD